MPALKDARVRNHLADTAAGVSEWDVHFTDAFAVGIQIAELVRFAIRLLLDTMAYAR